VSAGLRPDQIESGMQLSRTEVAGLEAGNCCSGDTGKVVMESILETKATTILEFFAGLRTLWVTFDPLIKGQRLMLGHELL
jgi:hypothetical protein